MPSTPLRSRALLSAMMFLQFAINGIWSIPLATYLETLGYRETQIAVAYMTLAWAAIISPLFVGMIADRFFAAERVLAVLNVLGGLFLYLAAQVVVGADGLPRPTLFFWVLLAHCTCYMPTWSLTNTIALAHVRDPGREFPWIRVMGTIGWIVVSAISLFCTYYHYNIEKTVWPMLIGAGLSVATGIYNFFLPHTPPQAAGKRANVGSILGFDALGLLKDRNFAVFIACSFLIMLPASFYWTFCNPYLNEIQMEAAQFKQSIGQMSEMIFMFLLPFFLRRFRMKTVLAMGLVAWAARFVLFAYGDMEWRVWMVYLALLLHGICFAFIFVVGPMYADRKAPKQLQASAQGLITFVTFGLGQLAGTYMSGVFLEQYAVKHATGPATHLWQPYWLWPAAMCAVIAGAFLAAFHERIDLGTTAETGTS